MSCNGGHPGFDSCATYCSQETLFLDLARNWNCYSVEQFEWLVTELQKAVRDGVDHIFVFAHAPLLSSSWSHPGTDGAEQLRALLEGYGVTIFFYRHNHAYERICPVRNSSKAAGGTTYITVGPGEAASDGIDGGWFTEASYQQWCTYDDLEKMATYVKIYVKITVGKSRGKSSASGFRADPSITSPWQNPRTPSPRRWVCCSGEITIAGTPFLSPGPPFLSVTHPPLP